MIDGILEGIRQRYEAELNRAAEKELTREMKKYGKKLENTIKKEWQGYLNSYSPVRYKRTGNTLESIHYSGNVGGTLASGMVTSVSYGSMATDRYSKSYRIPFKAIDEGWNSGPRPYRYAYYEGYGLTDKIMSEFEGQLPSYINLTMR